MGFTWRINIRRSAPLPAPATFTFDVQPPQVEVGDHIFWSNDDGVAHWPVTADNQNLFMTTQIAPFSTSVTFSPSAAGTIQYKCCLHKNEAGTIEVKAKPSAAPTT